MPFTTSAAAARAAVSAAAGFGIGCTDPVILADGANVIVHLTPSPVVAKVAASTTAVRPDAAAGLQRELLNLTVWYSVYAERLPECRERAAELVASWRQR
jgi:hypothetical protein